MNRKKITAIVLSSLLIVTICIGGIWGYKKYNGNKNQVEVMPVSYISSNWFQDEIRSSGMITSSQLQEVRVENKNTIKEVFVKEGDEVKVGDKLLSYDTTVLELDLEEQKIKIQQSDMKSKSLKSEIEKLKNTKPILKKTALYSKSYVELLTTTNDIQFKNLNEQSEIKAYSLIDGTSKPYTGDGTIDSPYRFVCTKDAIITGGFLNQLMGYDASGKNKNNEPCIAVFEVYNNDNKDGILQYLWTVNGKDYSEPVKEDSKWSLKFINNEENKPVDPPIEPPIEEPVEPPVEEGYTKAELDTMIAKKQDELRDEGLNKRELELGIKKIEKKLNESIVTASVNGIIKKVQNKDELKKEEPFLVLNGGNGFYITGSISELLLGTIKKGDVVTAQSWSESGSLMYTATITEVSDYPVDNNMNYGGQGNANVSYYPFTAVIEDQEGLASGQYVDIMMNAVSEENTNALYISKAYIRQEDGKSYVFLADENDRLFKKFVETGKIVQGDMIEVKNGITQEDRIAFPYGKYVKEGTRVKNQDENIMFK